MNRSSIHRRLFPTAAAVAFAFEAAQSLTFARAAALIGALRKF